MSDIRRETFVERCHEAVGLLARLPLRKISGVSR